jgi:hypothetical protein
MGFKGIKIFQKNQFAKKKRPSQASLNFFKSKVVYIILLCKNCVKTKKKNPYLLGQYF